MEFEFFPQSAQAGLVSDDKGSSISSHEVVIISDDDSEDPRSPKEGGDGRQRRRSAPRLRWTLSEDCKLIEAVASRRQKLVWRAIAEGFPERSGNSCRLRWLKLLKPEDASIDNRWSEIATWVGDRAINQWRVKIARNLPDFYALISANHTLNKSCVQNASPMFTGSVGGDDHGVGDTSVVGSTIDLSLSLAITGHNQNSMNVAATTTTENVRLGPLYDCFGSESE